MPSLASVRAKVFALLALAFPIVVYGNPFTVTVDTSALVGTVGSVAFDFIDGGSPANVVTISDFITDGTLGSSSSIGDVTGAFPGPVTLGDSSFFSEYLQGVTLGTSLSFTLASTNHPEDLGSFPDGFSLFLLDGATGLSLVTTDDPTGSGALLLWSQGAPSPEIYAADSASVSISSVPEPTPVYLVLAATLALVVVRQLLAPPRRNSRFV